MKTLTYEAGTSTERWHDSKRYWWALGLIVPLLPLNAIWRVHATGQGWQYWNGPILVFLLIPLLDLMLGTDRSNAPDWAAEPLASDRYYRWLTYLFIPLQYVAFFWARTRSPPNRCAGGSTWGCRSPSERSAGLRSTRRTSWATSRRRSSGTWPSSRWLRPGMGTSVSNTTADIICGLRPRRPGQLSSR